MAFGTDPKTALHRHPYREFLTKVAKPARYTGGEVGAVVKPWTDEVATFCLAFPDVYDIGMSHLGFKILYKILNDDPRTLAERVYAPWVDLEAELRERDLPLVSLESYRPLCDFDVVGFSLQFELTYTNVLTMLELGRIPLRSADRGEDDPLIVAGGPTATHPEPLSAFIDAFVIGDGEEKATNLALTWKQLKAEGKSRKERLEALAASGAVYVPSLYETCTEEATGMLVVDRTLSEHAPLPVRRALVDLDDYPFPDDSPTGGPEAIFDRMSIEIARGCTEGCRFCQAGMIYRPVRERDPQQVVDTVLSAVEKSGHSEASLTALSTADVSCISPLIKTIGHKLADKGISLGVSSLRAYGLEPELLDELKQVRASGLTFAPEAGSPRMRDVVNKNVTEDQLLETAERIFVRGWGRMKLYFMIGLPTETDDDVRGTVETGLRALAHGKEAMRNNGIKGRAPEVTVSVSTHVPKPHTPFQWCAMDTLSEVERKQGLLREAARKKKGLKLRTHQADASVLEGVFARGDRSLCDVLEHAYRGGARFDSWEDQIDLSLWQRAFEACGVEPDRFLGTLPTGARLPWDHIDVGLEEGFLAREYRKALSSRLSPPCGKVAGQFIHHTSEEAAQADRRRLVCYDCGVACDLTQMRSERIVFLRRMGATKAKPAEPMIEPPEVVVEPANSEASEAEAAPKAKSARRPDPGPPSPHRLLLRFEKLGASSLLGHLDLVRELPRVFRRAKLPLAQTRGFHPKPDMTFGPALSLGAMSLDEAVMIRLEEPLTSERIAALPRELTSLAPLGLRFVHAEVVPFGAPSLSKVVTGARFALFVPREDGLEERIDAHLRAFLERGTHVVERVTSGIKKRLDLRPLVAHAKVCPEPAAIAARAGVLGDLVAVELEVVISPAGAARPAELAHALLPPSADGGVRPHQAVRLDTLGTDRLAAGLPPSLSKGPAPSAAAQESA